MSNTWAWPPGWRRLREQVFRRDGRVCWRCHGYADSVDHILAVALGGSHALSNLRPACTSCNSSTGASMGNRLRPRRPRHLTGRQRQAIAAKRAGTSAAPTAGWQSARRW
jgi:5-methylcytosine-specific restriction endonuclease McrA